MAYVNNYRKFFLYFLYKKIKAAAENRHGLFSQSFQIDFGFPVDAVAFDGLLYRLFQNGGGQFFLRKIGENLLFLLGEGGGKIPRLHHLHIIVIARYGGDGIGKRASECTVKIVPHQGAHPVPYGVGILVF